MQFYPFFQPFPEFCFARASFGGPSTYGTYSSADTARSTTENASVGLDETRFTRCDVQADAYTVRRHRSRGVRRWR